MEHIVNVEGHISQENVEGHISQEIGTDEEELINSLVPKAETYTIKILLLPFPAYRNMDSFPFQRNQIPFPYHHYHPGIETVPPQMRTDSTKPPFPYEQPWPYAGNYGHSTPVHFCCGHNNFPGCYSYRPYVPSPAPSPMYYPGGYPSYGEPFFAPYSPHHTMEVPRYEYDKYVPKEHHCCGCPNHVCNNKEGSNVKIEEYKDDAVKKEKDDMVPVHLGNYPYYGDRQLKKSTVHDKTPTSPKNLDACGQSSQEPKVLWNGWLPFDIKSAPNMVHNGEGIRSQNREADNHIRESEDSRMDQKQQSEEPKRSEFPFPIMWWPFFNKPEEGGKTHNQKSNSTPECIEEVPKSHTLKSVPVKSSVHEGVAKKPSSNGVEFKDTTTASVDDTRKVANQRTIPVKQMEKNAYEGSEKREMKVPVIKMEDKVMKEDSHSSSKRGSTSPRNGSKLPPVCLRVDPLPRKRNGNGKGNGSSRSPSPPATKEHSHSKPMASETNKAPSSSMNEKAKPVPNLNSQNAPNKVRTIQVTENKTGENKGNECQSQTNMPSGVSTLTTESYTNDRNEDKKEKRTENMTGEATEHSVKDTSKQTNEGSKKEGKVLLDADAAVLIQAAFRGYQVRRWQQLKKLKQIAEVSKEVTDVRSRIQAFEDSPDLQNNEKEKIAIGETIMRLLLKLDTIQGLHPSLREIRKSLARELVTLQEKLDSMMTKKPQQKMNGFDVQKPIEVPPLNEEYHQEQQEEKVEEPEDSSKDNSEDSHDTSEEHHDQFCMNDGNSNSPPNDGGSKSQSLIDHASNEGMEPNVLANDIINEESSQMVTVSALDSTSNLCETDITAVKLDEKDTQQDEKLDMTALKELPVGVLDEDIVDIGSENQPKDGLDLDVQAMMELPVGVLDEEDTVTSDFRKVDETKTPQMEAQAENDVFIEELPVGLLDEDTTISEVLPVEGLSERPESTTNDNAKETRAEQPLPLLEEQKEVQSCGELADGWVKIDFQKEDELKGDAPEESKESLATQVTSHDQGNEEPCFEASDETNILPEPVEYVKEPEEKFGQQEKQVDGYSETEEPAVVEHGEGLNGDVSLLEENEKLRKLMKELLEAGNEQLSVISNLTGRVKDLEKKLERTRSRRSERLRTNRYRKATPKMSCYSLSE